MFFNCGDFNKIPFYLVNIYEKHDFRDSRPKRDMPPDSEVIRAKLKDEITWKQVKEYIRENGDCHYDTVIFFICHYNTHNLRNGMSIYNYIGFTFKKLWNLILRFPDISKRIIEVRPKNKEEAYYAKKLTSKGWLVKARPLKWSYWCAKFMDKIFDYIKID